MDSIHESRLHGTIIMLQRSNETTIRLL